VFTRIVIVVLDSVGAGALPDAAEYGDLGADTLGNIARCHGGLFLPTLESLGLGCIRPLDGVQAVDRPLAGYGKMAEVSKGKDTTTGHWEMAGCPVFTAFPVYPGGFPAEVANRIAALTGRHVIGNKAASGTEIIAELGEEHLRTGALIVYTSADSVLQIAAHEAAKHARADLPVAPPAAAAQSGADRQENAASGRLAEREARTLASQLGTGFGRDEASFAQQVRFERASGAPAETIAIQYDRRENLIAMGVLPAPRYAQRNPEPFPAMRFVPAPR
jgi:hypothetical protein